MSKAIIRMSQLATTPKRAGLLPVSPATVWRWVRLDQFPKPFKVGPRITAWDLADVEAFLASRAKEGQK